MRWLPRSLRTGVSGPYMSFLLDDPSFGGFYVFPLAKTTASIPLLLFPLAHCPLGQTLCPSVPLPSSCPHALSATLPQGLHCPPARCAPPCPRFHFHIPRLCSHTCPAGISPHCAPFSFPFPTRLWPRPRLLANALLLLPLPVPSVFPSFVHFSIASCGELSLSRNL